MISKQEFIVVVDSLLSNVQSRHESLQAPEEISRGQVKDQSHWSAEIRGLSYAALKHLSQAVVGNCRYSQIIESYYQRLIF